MRAGRLGRSNLADITGYFTGYGFETAIQLPVGGAAPWPSWASPGDAAIGDAGGCNSSFAALGSPGAECHGHLMLVFGSYLPVRKAVLGSASIWSSMTGLTWPLW